MTTPISEAAVEAAARAIFNAEKGHGLALDATYDAALWADQELRRRMARAALTAARPHVEAEIRGQVATEIRELGDEFGATLGGMHRAVMNREPHDFTTDDMHRYSAYTHAYGRAATIAERTQR